MNKLVLAALASLLIAVVVPSALAASPGVTPANGNDVVLADGSVYQLNDDGSYSWIPNVATANAMGLDWSSLQSVDVLPGPVGARFPAVVTLANALATKTPVATTSTAAVAKANGNDFVLPDGNVYQQNDDGSYSWIPDVATANAMGLNWNNLQQVVTLDGPLGPPFPHA